MYQVKLEPEITKIGKDGKAVNFSIIKLVINKTPVVAWKMSGL